MKTIKVINEHNLSADKINKLPIHKKARGVVYVDENTIVCIEENSHGVIHLLGLPGGGVEKDEDDIKAFRREVKEETGYEIEDIVALGTIELVKKRYRSITNCYTAKIKGEIAEQEFTEEEKEIETRSINISINNAAARISEEYDKKPNNNSLRSIIILKEVMKLNQSK